MDVTDDASMVAGVRRVLDEQGRLDVLVNNAGYGSYGALEDVSLDEARRQFEVNVFGLARLIQLVTPTMREQGSGRIINVSSVGGRLYEPFGAWYHATKFAVEGLSDSLRMELRPFGIDVVVIQPAAIVTEWNTIARDSLLEQSGESAYGSYAKRAHRVMAAADKPGSMMANTPDVVGRKIAKAATVKRPAARYPVGKGPALSPPAATCSPTRCSTRSSAAPTAPADPQDRRAGFTFFSWVTAVPPRSSRNEPAQAATSCSATVLRIAFIRWCAPSGRRSTPRASGPSCR
jgi:NAD(P)-dependent dehydrogenase (short-subunit alcohol dehydrogenase family)